MANLDRNKPYSQIVNDEEGRCYEQNGAYFTADGKPWTAPATDAPAPAKAGKKAAASQLDAQLQEPA